MPRIEIPALFAGHRFQSDGWSPQGSPSGNPKGSPSGNRVEVLGIPMDVLIAREALREIGSFFKREGQFHIATPNPEMLVEAQKNEAFRSVLQHTHLNLPDGIGLVWAMKRRQKRGKRQPFSAIPDLSALPFERVTGIDMVQALCSREARICPPERVFLLGAAPGIAERAAEMLRRKNPALHIVGTYAGSPQQEHDEEIVARINEGGPTLLFVAFGAPSQDLWIARNLSKLRPVKVAIGVGGAFDFLAGRRKRAPLLFRTWGLEWLWRLLLEPRRIGRIWNATIVFPLMVLRERSEPPI